MEGNLGKEGLIGGWEDVKFKAETKQKLKNTREQNETAGQLGWDSKEGRKMLGWMGKEAPFLKQ